MRIVFLFDVDNTLLDTDRVTADVRRFLSQQISPEEQQHYFAIFEELRAELGYADYLGALQRYRLAHPHHTEIMHVSLYLLNYHFAERLFPGALDVIEYVKQFGAAVILSDGDVVFQPCKIESAGLLNAFDGNVLIFVHKEMELDAVQEKFPADHYVMVDDKLRILDAMKQAWGARLTTVWVRQGHYAREPRHLQGYRAADVTLEQIADLMEYDVEKLLEATRSA
ncbi:MAG: HAD family hydrolase [Chloroflexi bacterium]|nr:HAD family hydrolase [Chloroflexota bacterium]